MRVTDRIADDLTDIVPKHALGQEIDWDVVLTVLPPPTPGQPAQLMGQIFLFARSPLLGEGDMVATALMPLEMTKNTINLDSAVSQMVATLDQMRQAKMQLPGQMN